MCCTLVLMCLAMLVMKMMVPVVVSWPGWWCLLCVMLVFSDHCVGADLGYKEGACELSSL